MRKTDSAGPNFSFSFSFLLDIFFIYISNVIPKVPYTLPPRPAPIPTHYHFLALAFLVLGHIKFAGPRGLSSLWWQTNPSSAAYAARDTALGVLVSSYFCSTYKVADPFSSLGSFSRSSIGAPVFHPKMTASIHFCICQALE